MIVYELLKHEIQALKGLFPFPVMIYSLKVSNLHLKIFSMKMSIFQYLTQALNLLQQKFILKSNLSKFQKLKILECDLSTY